MFLVSGTHPGVMLPGFQSWLSLCGLGTSFTFRSFDFLVCDVGLVSPYPLGDGKDRSMTEEHGRYLLLHMFSLHSNRTVR